MAKNNFIHEVEVVRFFEAGPIEKAEVVFNIVREKMRERLGNRGAESKDVVQRKGRRSNVGRLVTEELAPEPPAQ